MRILVAVFLTVICQSCFSAEPEKPLAHQAMTNEGIKKHIESLGLELEGDDGFWTLIVKEQPVQIITDTKADRMRIIAPIVKADELSKGMLYRLMQANFESALDARYAITNEVVWGTYIHPLSPMTNNELESGLVQVLSLVATFGTSFSSTGFTFGDGSTTKQGKSVTDIKTI